MSLRVRLFILFGGLLALLAGAEWWLVRSLTRSLSVEVGEVATSVGRHMFRFVGKPEAAIPATPPPAAGPNGKPAHYVFFHSETRTQAGPLGQRNEVEVRTEEALPGVGKVTRVLKVHGPNLDTTIPIPEAGFGHTVTEARLRDRDREIGRAHV